MTPTIEKKLKAIQAGKVPAGYRKTAVGIVPKEWEVVRFYDKFLRITRKNAEGNTNVLTISAQHGLINQNDFFKKNIASEDKSNYYLLRKGEFAYNKSYSNGYPFGALKRLDFYDKGIVSPLYICFAANDSNRCSDFYVHYFEAGLMNREIQAFAQEGARNHGLLNISVDDFFKANLLSPPLPEQRKIAEILTAQDRVIALKEKLVAEKRKQKKFLMQRLFSADDMRPFKINEVIIDKNKWKKIPASEILTERTETKGGQKLRICSVAVHDGVIDQLKHLGKSMAAADTSKYGVAHYGDIVYTKSPTGLFPYGIIKQNLLQECVAVSPLYGIFKPINIDLGYLLHEYFSYPCNANNYLHPIINKGAKNTILIANQTFLQPQLFMPLAVKETSAIAEVLSAADREISLREQDLEQERKKKKSLMQLLLSGIVRVNIQI